MGDKKNRGGPGGEQVEAGEKFGEERRQKGPVPSQQPDQHCTHDEIHNYVGG